VKATWKADAVALGMIAAMFVLAAVAWTGVPDRMPVHWNWLGQPDRFGGRLEGLLGLPLAAILVYALLIFLPRIDPRRKHYDDFQHPFAIMRTVVVGVFFGLQVATFLWVRDAAGPPRGLLVAEAGIALILIGNYLPKIKSNWFVGVRTPWTLSSEVSWHLTHRLAGRLFVIAGALDIVIALVQPAIASRVMFATLITAAVISIVYSYVVWRRDSARASGAIST
jgi:immunity protein, SdpI family